MSELVASAWQLANPPGKAGHTYLYMVRHFFMVVYRTWYGKKKTNTFEVFIPKEIPTFDAKMPNLPGAPVAPEIEQFDTSKNVAQREGLSQGMQREIGERSAARRNVMQRGRGRTLLQGA